jgi:hypothetical protein
LFNNGDLAYTLWKEEMERAERAAELQRMLPRRERRRFPAIHLTVPGIRRRTRFAAPHGC